MINIERFAEHGVAERTQQPALEVRPIMNIPEAASYLRVSVRQVHRLLKARKIRAATIGRRLVFKRADLDRFIDLQLALST